MSTKEKFHHEPIRLLVVEDSRTTRTYIESILAPVPEFHLLASATDGQEAIDKAIRLEPDVILMDLQLPIIGGVDAITTIMAERPCPIVVLSGYLDPARKDLTFQALNAGAVDVIAKPRGLGQPMQQGFADELIRLLRIMARVKVVTQRFGPPGLAHYSEAQRTLPETDIEPVIDLVAIGASTGGPAALFEILSELPLSNDVPVVIAQHIADGFEHGLCSWLRTTGHKVEIPLPGTPIEPAKIYLSPANASLVVEGHFLDIAPPVGREIAPNIDRLFSSVARYHGRRGSGILLTGMGRDGARGLLELYEAGGWTIAQDSDTAVVDSMPVAAADAGAAREVLALDEIARRLRTLVRPSQGEQK